MPNRMLRQEIVESRKMARLSDAAKAFYYKMLSLVDDYGRYEADPELLRRRAYMWELERVSASDVGVWVNECRRAEMVNVYSVAGKEYLEILNFKQQIRAGSKYPDDRGVYSPAPDRKKKAASSGEHVQACASNGEHVPACDMVPSRLVSPRLALINTLTESTGGLEPAVAPPPPPSSPSRPSQGSYGKSAIAVLHHFPDADDKIIERIAKQAFLAVEGVSDDELAEAIRETYRPTQKSPGLWITTAPEYMRRKREGRLDRKPVAYDPYPEVRIAR